MIIKSALALRASKLVQEFGILFHRTIVIGKMENLRTSLFTLSCLKGMQFEALEDGLVFGLTSGGKGTST